MLNFIYLYLAVPYYCIQHVLKYIRFINSLGFNSLILS